MEQATITLTVLGVLADKPSGGVGASAFFEKSLTLDDYNGMMITPRIDAQNFRHRFSKAGYQSDWHVAGDPTLIIIRAGTLRIGLRSGEYKDFSAGDMFVAQDYLSEGETFNDELHGHNAKVIGDEPLLAVHIKLSDRYDIER